MSNTEKERLERLKEYQESGNKSNLEPGSFAFHEAFHGTFLAYEFFNDAVLEHPAIYHNKELYTAANEINTKMWELYQKLGLMHMSKKNGVKDGDV